MTDQATERVIVSMTTFPDAAEYAVRALRSLLRGSVLPDKLVLYLAYEQFQEGIPASLTRLADEYPLLEIRDAGPDIRSYKKLVPALRDFPDDVIVTVDDDVHYHRHMLRDLLRLHRRFPATILAHRARRINVGAPYRKWKKYRWYHFLTRRYRPSLLNLPTGVGGVLYPPHSLDMTMMQRELFTALAPTTDDIWFWGAATAQGTPVMPVPFGRNKPRGLKKPEALSLKRVNYKGTEDRNARALSNILEHFPAIGERLQPDTEGIDLVYLWVDGSDPAWRARHDALTGQERNESTDGAGRYTDNDELRYSLRSIARYAPWVSKIHIVTDRQVPPWLDTSHPRIHVVDHSEILPPEAMPCFNSCILEHHLHLIPGLSERFLYANDDTLLNRPVTPADFFAPDGLPYVRAHYNSFRHLYLRYRIGVRKHRLQNYKLTLHRTALLVASRYGRYYPFRTHHNIDAYLRSNNERVRRLFDPEITATLTNHLRADNDIQRNIYSYVPLAEHRAHLRYVGKSTSFRFNIDNPKKYDAFRRANPVFYCMNDSEYATDADRRRAAAFLAQLLPEPCEFELPE